VRIADDVAALIAAAGMGVAFTSFANGPYDAATGAPQLVPTTVQIRAYVTPVDLQRSGFHNAVAGDSVIHIAATDMPVGMVPKTEDSFALNGIVFRLIDVRQTYLGGAVVRYIGLARA
jgi:hypothetical protein